MTDKKKPTLIEAAAQMLGEKVVTGGGATGQSKGPEPVAAQGGGSHKNRPQDKLQGDPMPKPQNPAGTPVQSTSTENNVAPTGDMSAQNRASVAMKPVREDIDAMFAGQEVSEEFKTKASTIFEAAVNARVAAVKEQVEAESKKQIEEAVAAINEDLSEKIDEYLNYVTEQWLEANAIAIESGLRAEVAESFMTGLRELFTEHYISIPDEQLDVAEALATKVQELETLLNDAVNENVELKKVVSSGERTKIETEVTEGLVETQKSKLKTLFEGVEFTTPEEFKKKLETVRDGYIADNKSAKKTDSVQNLLEQVDPEQTGDKPAAIVEPQIKGYVDAIARTARPV